MTDSLYPKHGNSPKPAKVIRCKGCDSEWTVPADSVWTAFICGTCTINPTPEVSR